MYGEVMSPRQAVLSGVVFGCVWSIKQYVIRCRARVLRWWDRRKTSGGKTVPVICRARRYYTCTRARPAFHHRRDGRQWRRRRWRDVGDDGAAGTIQFIGGTVFAPRAPCLPPLVSHPCRRMIRVFVGRVCACVLVFYRDNNVGGGPRPSRRCGRGKPRRAAHVSRTWSPVAPPTATIAWRLPDDTTPPPTTHTWWAVTPGAR